MNEMLSQMLAELNLQPGQSHRVQVNGYHLEIRRPVEQSTDFADMVMFQAWVEFPRPPGTAIDIRAGRLPLPDPPDIPADYAENAGQRCARVRPIYREHLAKHFADTFSRIGLPRPYETM